MSIWKNNFNLRWMLRRDLAGKERLFPSIWQTPLSSPGRMFIPRNKCPLRAKLDSEQTSKKKFKLREILDRGDIFPLGGRRWSFSNHFQQPLIRAASNLCVMRSLPKAFGGEIWKTYSLPASVLQ